MNEAEYIRRSVQSVRTQCPEADIIVVDGGSSDATGELASTIATVIRSDRGRALQMNTGAAQARGDILLFLHADSVLHKEALSHMKACLDDPFTVGGTFSLKFDSDRSALRFFAYFTRFPFRLFHYGDQGIFVRRPIFEALAGFKAIPLMEDIDFLNRLRRLGRVGLVRAPVTTSARRYLENGIIRQQCLDCFLVAAFLAGLKPETLSRWYNSNKKALGKPGRERH